MSKKMLKKFKKYKKEVENQLSKKIKKLKTDGSREYQKALRNYLKEHGIIYEIIALYSSEQNRVSEQAN